jgi:hypothetical protein
LEISLGRIQLVWKEDNKFYLYILNYVFSCVCVFLAILISLMFGTQMSLGTKEKPDGAEGVFVCVCVERGEEARQREKHC